MTNKTLLFACLLFLFSCSKTDEFSAPKVVVNTIDNVVNDMEGLHEAPPFGVPLSYTWQAGPRIGLGNNPAVFRPCCPGARFLKPTPATPATNTRVEIRNLSLLPE
jgi:hypothetical protein